MIRQGFLSIALKEILLTLLKMKKNEIEVKFELSEDEFNSLLPEGRSFAKEITLGFFRKDFSNIKEGVFPRIKLVENKFFLFGVKKKLKEDPDFKERVESELLIDSDLEKNLEIAKSIFFDLGFTEAIVFEKKRLSVNKGGVEVSFDILPFGFFVEIEGEKHLINSVVEKLGLSSKKRITSSYLALWKDFKEKNNISVKDCVLE